MSKPMELSAGMQRALEKVVRKYDRSIRQLQNGVPAWKVVMHWDGYGDCTVCLLCKAAGPIELGRPPCLDCPVAPCSHDTHWDLRQALKTADSEELLVCMQDRLEWLHKRIGEAGWEVV